MNRNVTVAAIQLSCSWDLQATISLMKRHDRNCDTSVMRGGDCQSFTFLQEVAA